MRKRRGKNQHNRKGSFMKNRKQFPFPNRTSDKREIIGTSVSSGGGGEGQAQALTGTRQRSREKKNQIIIRKDTIPGGDWVIKGEEKIFE